MTFDLNGFFAGIRLRAQSFPCSIVRSLKKIPMPKDIFAGLHDYGIVLWQFEDTGRRNLRLGRIVAKKILKETRTNGSDTNAG